MPQKLIQHSLGFSRESRMDSIMRSSKSIMFSTRTKNQHISNLLEFERKKIDDNEHLVLIQSNRSINNERDTLSKMLAVRKIYQRHRFEKYDPVLHPQKRNRLCHLDARDLMKMWFKGKTVTIAKTESDGHSQTDSRPPSSIFRRLYMKGGRIRKMSSISGEGEGGAWGNLMTETIDEEPNDDVDSLLNDDGKDVVVYCLNDERRHIVPADNVGTVESSNKEGNQTDDTNTVTQLEPLEQVDLEIAPTKPNTNTDNSPAKSDNKDDKDVLVHCVRENNDTVQIKTPQIDVSDVPKGPSHLENGQLSYEDITVTNNLERGITKNDTLSQDDKASTHRSISVTKTESPINNSDENEHREIIKDDCRNVKVSQSPTNEILMNTSDTEQKALTTKEPTTPLKACTDGSKGNEKSSLITTRKLVKQSDVPPQRISLTERERSSKSSTPNPTSKSECSLIKTTNKIYISKSQEMLEKRKHIPTATSKSESMKMPTNGKNNNNCSRERPSLMSREKSNLSTTFRHIKTPKSVLTPIVYRKTKAEAHAKKEPITASSTNLVKPFYNNKQKPNTGLPTTAPSILKRTTTDIESWIGVQTAPYDRRKSSSASSLRIDKSLIQNAATNNPANWKRLIHKLKGYQNEAIVDDRVVAAKSTRRLKRREKTFVLSRERTIFPGECKSTYEMRRFVEREVTDLMYSLSPKGRRQSQIELLKERESLRLQTFVNRTKSTSAILRDFRKYSGLPRTVTAP